jgi:hypothetical protein
MCLPLHPDYSEVASGAARNFALVEVLSVAVLVT